MSSPPPRPHGSKSSSSAWRPWTCPPSRSGTSSACPRGGRSRSSPDRRASTRLKSSTRALGPSPSPSPSRCFPLHTISVKPSPLFVAPVPRGAVAGIGAALVLAVGLVYKLCASIGGERKVQEKTVSPGYIIHVVWVDPVAPGPVPNPVPLDVGASVVRAATHLYKKYKSLQIAIYCIYCCSPM